MPAFGAQTVESLTRRRPCEMEAASIVGKSLPDVVVLMFHEAKCEVKWEGKRAGGLLSELRPKLFGPTSPLSAAAKRYHTDATPSRSP